MKNISKIKGTTTCEPVSADSLDGLAELLTQSDVCAGIFEGNYRTKKNFKYADWLLLDVDQDRTLEEAKEDLRKLGVNFALTTTRNHQKIKNPGTTSEKPACDRFRVLIECSERIFGSAQYERCTHYFHGLLPYVDAQALDSARWFIRSERIYSIYTDGKPFDPNSAPEKSTKKEFEPKTSRTQKGNLSYATTEFIKYGALPGNWNPTLFKVAKDYQQQNFTEGECIADLEKAENDYFSGEFDHDDLKTISSAFRAPPKHPPRISEPSKLGKNKKMSDLIVSTLGGTPRYNEMKDQIFVGDRPLDDFDISTIKIAARSSGKDSSKDYVVDLINDLSRQNSYHPFRDYILSARWDQQDHIEKLFRTIQLDSAFLEHENFFKTTLTKFLVGMVKKIFKPGEQTFCLVLKGKQGTQKSRWIARLNVVEGAFAEGLIDPESKDCLNLHLTTNLYHISELDSVTRRRDVASLKDYLTKEVVTVRRPYDRFSRQGRSQVSFIASVNTEDFLKDTTGDRRFVVFPITLMNAEHSVDLQQVFAQSFSLFQDGFQNWLTDGEVETQKAINSYFRPETLSREIVSLLVPGSDEKIDWLTLSEIKNLGRHKIKGFDDRKINDSDLRNLLNQQGFRKAEIKRNGSRQMRYFVRLNVEAKKDDSENSFNSKFNGTGIVQ